MTPDTGADTSDQVTVCQYVMCSEYADCVIGAKHNLGCPLSSISIQGKTSKFATLEDIGMFVCALCNILLLSASLGFLLLCTVSKGLWV